MCWSKDHLACVDFTDYYIFDKGIFICIVIKMLYTNLLPSVSLLTQSNWYYNLQQQDISSHLRLDKTKAEVGTNHMSAWATMHQVKSRSHAAKFLDFVGKIAPVKSRHDKQLVLHDPKSNNFNYKYTFFVEICSICREDLWILTTILCVFYIDYTTRVMGNLYPML
ncbi:NMD3-like protein [Artemisia annua]|uniref:60S ribosomal export protein NMD3 n=1 Tax=Artemisia annua TaxID=35608 RepID=A0A2U1KD75_ARTAN|nr:NMD3-like protein [Artemisia annua]